MDLKNKIKPIHVILLVIFLTYLTVNINTIILEWDAIGYILNGQTLLGQHSYFKWHGPPLWPFIIALLGGGELLSRIMGISLSVFSVYAIYLFAKEVFNEDTANLSAIIFASIPLVFNWATKLYTTIPMMGLSALALYFLVRYDKKEDSKNLYLFFLTAALSYLMKYPGLMVLVVGIIYLIISKKLRKEILLGLVIFLIVISPWLYFNYINTGDMFYSPNIANGQMSRTPTGDNYLYFSTWNSTFTLPLTMLVLFGLYLFLKNIKIKNPLKIIHGNRRYLLVWGIFLSYFIYIFTILNLKSIRYLLPCMLGWSILSGDGLNKLLEKIKINKTILIIVFLLFIVVGGYMELTMLPKYNGFETIDKVLIKDGNAVSNYWPFLNYYTDTKTKWIPEPYERLINQTQEYGIRYVVVTENVNEPDYADIHFFRNKTAWKDLGEFQTAVGKFGVFEYTGNVSGDINGVLPPVLSARNFIPLKFFSGD